MGSEEAKWIQKYTDRAFGCVHTIAVSEGYRHQLQLDYAQQPNIWIGESHNVADSSKKMPGRCCLHESQWPEVMSVNITLPGIKSALRVSLHLLSISRR